MTSRPPPASPKHPDSVDFDLSGQTTLRLVGAPGPVLEAVAAQMDPFPAAPSAATEPDVVLETVDDTPAARYVDIQNPARDGITTASDGKCLWILDDESACSLPEALDSRPAHFTYHPTFPMWRLFEAAVRPALQLSLPPKGAAAIHATTVEVDEGGVAIAGWSESGKTETALALMEAGAGFLSDKWTVHGADGRLSAFPIGVGIRRWVLPFLPRLRSALPPSARAQLVAAGIAAAASRPIRRRPARGRVVDLAAATAERALALADRAGLTPSQLRAAYGDTADPCRRIPCVAVALLTTAPTGPVVVDEADPGWAARRLSRTAAFERRGYFALQARAQYAFADDCRADQHPAEWEERLLTRALEETTVLRVHAPFPTDPRPVAQAIASRL